MVAEPRYRHHRLPGGQTNHTNTPGRVRHDLVTKITDTLQQIAPLIYAGTHAK